MGDEAWHEPQPQDPLSLVDQVELALAYNCEDRLTTKTLIGYIHRNRHHNALQINTLEQEIEHVRESVKKLSTKAAVCGYQLQWTRASSVITYDSVDNLGGELGNLDASTGVFTAPAAGVYQVAWSLHSGLDSGERNFIYLHRNGQRVSESERNSYNADGNYAIVDQGGRTMLQNLQRGDTLNLKTGSFTGGASKISFCVHLVSPQ